ncbi:hypothetical protein RhiJN_17779 [Ceratobasidium sp. AG-Ba]|nr:hypothetical protein RhiJN_17779 [Ceratobasidium sp. AG-Ba]
MSLLPDNPKLWTPAQLAQYLLTALRFKGFKSSEVTIVPKPVAHDIANFVIKCKLDGRMFLRLTDNDIEKWGVNKLWRVALLSSSCELRKSLLKGRIWGFSPEEEFIGAQSVRKPERRIPSTVMEQEGLTSPNYSNVPSAPAAAWLRNTGNRPWVDWSQSPSLGFESDASSRSIISSSAARPRALSTSSIASSAVGRVQRMIRKLEQGRDALDVGSVQSNDESCLASDEMTSESEDDPEGDVAWNTAAISSEAGGLSSSSDTHGMVHVHPESIWTRPLSFPVNSRPNTSGTTLIETPLLLRSTDSPTIPQLARSSNSPHRDFSEANSITLHEEPTVEALLREERGIQEKRPLGTSWGAEAWEEDFPGGTSRRIPAATPAARASSRPSTDDIQREPVVIPRAGWNDLCKRLGETERRLGMLERQEAEREETVGKLQRSKTDDPDELQAPAPGNLSPKALPSYLVIVGVGVCTLAAQFLAERMIGRRSHF